MVAQNSPAPLPPKENPGTPVQGTPRNPRIDRQALPPLIRSPNSLLELRIFKTPHPQMRNNRDQHPKPCQRPPTAASLNSPPPPPRSRPTPEGQLVGQLALLPGLQGQRDYSPQNPLRARTAAERTRLLLLNYSHWSLIRCFLKTRPGVGSQGKPPSSSSFVAKTTLPRGLCGRYRRPGPSGGSM